MAGNLLVIWGRRQENISEKPKNRTGQMNRGRGVDLSVGPSRYSQNATALFVAWILVNPFPDAINCRGKKSAS